MTRQLHGLETPPAITIPGHRMTERVGAADHPDSHQRDRHVFVCECGWMADSKRFTDTPERLAPMAAYNHAMGHLAEQVLEAAG